MKHIISVTYLLVSLFGLSPFCAADNIITATSKISQVTLFQDRALVTRSLNIELPEGESRIVFDSMPSTINSESLKVNGSGEGSGDVGTDVTILGVEYKSKYLTTI